MSDIARERDLVCEELARQISKAGRWTAVMEAWQALMNVQRKADALMSEQEYLFGEQSEGSPNLAAVKPRQEQSEADQ